MVVINLPVARGWVLRHSLAVSGQWVDQKAAEELNGFHTDTKNWIKIEWKAYADKAAFPQSPHYLSNLIYLISEVTTQK